MEPYIDAHSHVWTPDTGHYPLASGFKVSDMKPASFTPEELLAHCRPLGVGRVNLIQMSYYRFDNSYMLDMIKLYPERFVGTAILDPFQEQVGRAMLELRPKGVVAFRIQPQYSKLPPEKWLEPEGYEAMFEASAKGGQALSCLIDSKAFAEVDRMCRKHPEALVIIDHLGRVGLDGTIRQEDIDALCALARHPKILIKVGAFYALGKKVPPYDDLGALIQSVVQAFGARRCLWESDCPFQVVSHKYADSISLVRDRLDFLTAEDKEWLLHRTAEQYLFRA